MRPPANYLTNPEIKFPPWREVEDDVIYRYIGDIPKSFHLDNMPFITRREPRLYSSRIGQHCRIVGKKPFGPYPLIIEWDDGFRGIAQMQNLQPVARLE